MNTPDETPRPVLRVVKGDASAEDIAVLTALVANSGGDEPAAAPQRGRWNDPAVLARRPLLPGPGAWRSSLR